MNVQQIMLRFPLDALGFALKPVTVIDPEGAKLECGAATIRILG
jgi:hypothetical protein